MRKFMTSLTAVATVTLAAVPALGLLQAAHAAEFEARVDAAGERVCRELAHGNPTGDFTIAGCKDAVRKQVAAQLSTSQLKGLKNASRAIPVSVAAR